MKRMSSLLLSCLLFMGLAVTAPDMAEAGLASVTYKVVHSDGSTVTAGEKHEFNGGSISFLDTIDEPNRVVQWIEETGGHDVYQEGWSRLYLDWPVRIKSIVLHKASLENKSIKEGWVRLEVQPVKGKWVNVFESSGKDVRQAVAISEKLRAVGPIKGVRILFRSPDRIVIGPVDINL